MTSRIIAAALLLLWIAGCASQERADEIHDAAKRVESKVLYDPAATVFSGLCRGRAALGPDAWLLIQREMIELAREICQRGDAGPEPDWDERYGRCAGGPVLYVELYCEDERPPDRVLHWLERTWR